jgi:hypothetical protein
LKGKFIPYVNPFAIKINIRPLFFLINSHK